MTRFRSFLCCLPRRLDPDQQHKISAVSLKRYRSALQGFVSFIIENNMLPHDLEHIDCLVVEYKNREDLSKNQLACLIASLEFFFPQIKGLLAWSKQVSVGQTVQHKTHHTVPIISAPAELFATHMAARNKARLGIGLLVQQATGLRPSELLELLSEHVLLPTGHVGRIILRLGAEVGTKVKREQVACLDSKRFPDVSWLLSLLVSLTPHGHKLFPFSYNQYNRELAAIERALGLDLGITPHSARAGFASERVALGDSVEETRSAGRWLSELSFRTYVDVVMAAQVQAMVSLAGFKNAMIFVDAHLVSYFPPEALALRNHGSAGLCQVQRPVLAEGDGLPSYGCYKNLNTATAEQAGGAGERGKNAGADSTRRGTSSQGKGPGKGANNSRKGSSTLKLPKGYRERPS